MKPLDAVLLDVAGTGLTGPFSVSGNFLYDDGFISGGGFTFCRSFICGCGFVFECGLISGGGCNTRSSFIKDCGFIDGFWCGNGSFWKYNATFVLDVGNPKANQNRAFICTLVDVTEESGNNHWLAILKKD